MHTYILICNEKLLAADCFLLSEERTFGNQVGLTLNVPSPPHSHRSVTVTVIIRLPPPSLLIPFLKREDQYVSSSPRPTLSIQHINK